MTQPLSSQRALLGKGKKINTHELQQIAKHSRAQIEQESVGNHSPAHSCNPSTSDGEGECMWSLGVWDQPQKPDGHTGVEFLGKHLF